MDTKQARWSPVYWALREAIVGRRIPPGTKLPEDELASIYSVSRALVRPALQALCHDKLVRLEPNRGAFVAQPTKQEAREVFEARMLIEPKVASLAAEAATPEAIRRLRHHLTLEHEATHANQDSDALILSARFHIMIADIAGHDTFSGFVKDLLSRSSLIIALYWKRRETTCESHAHHALVDAIERHNTKESARLMNDHLIDLLAGLDLAFIDQQDLSLSEMLQNTFNAK